MNGFSRWYQRFFGLLLLALLTAASGAAQEAVVTHNVNLRNDPSTTHAPIRLLAPPDIVELLQAEKTNGYYHVRTADDDEGWVYGNYVRVMSADESEPASPETALGPPPPPPGPAAEVSSDWEKPVPGETTFQSAGQTCGPTGDGGDTETNSLKNRTDVPASYHEVQFDAVASLLFPNPASKHRHDWSAAQLDIIKPFEGAAVTVVGYIVAIKPQTGGSGESTNCHWTKAAQVDWHMALTQDAGQGEAEAVVVETTPRVRKAHPKWTTTALKPWLNSDAPVRISGWLMVDPEHRAHLGTFRSTLWEIHPITKIEVFRDGAWIDLDNLP